MKALRVLLAAALLLAFAAQVAPARAQACTSTSGWYVASLDGNIDPGASDFLSSSLASAQSACAGHFVFVLNTNGGDGGSMESMISAIGGYQGWGGTFITLVAPSYTHAWSAGSYIAEASTKIYMLRNTSIGAATPIVSGIPVGEENGTYSKDIGAFASYMSSLASTNGRNFTAAERMVTIPAQAYTAEKALRLHVIDGVLQSATVNGALAEIGVPAGTGVNTPGVRSQLISLFSDPNVSGLMFLVGVFAVLADIYHPTVVLSVIGVVVIAVALFGLGLFGASALSIALMLIGAAFIFLEVKIQHGISALIGVIIFVFGFLLVFQPPAVPASLPSGAAPPGLFIGISTATYILLGVIGGLVVIGSIYLLNLREGLMGRPKHFDMSRMVGKEGRLESDLAADGTGVANIGSEQWTVTSAQAIKKGARIRVIGVSGLHLKVEAAPS